MDTQEISQGWLWLAYAIGIIVVGWQVYEFFSPQKVKPNAQPEIYQRLEEIKRMRRERNQRGEFNEKDLTKYDGAQNPERYVGVKNDIFDVTEAKDFKEGGQMEDIVGQEISVNLAKLSTDPALFFQYNIVELTPEETQQLEATHAAFSANYKKIGKLQPKYSQKKKTV